MASGSYDLARCHQKRFSSRGIPRGGVLVSEVVEVVAVPIFSSRPLFLVRTVAMAAESRRAVYPVPRRRYSGQFGILFDQERNPLPLLMGLPGFKEFWSYCDPSWSYMHPAAGRMMNNLGTITSRPRAKQTPTFSRPPQR